MLRQSRFHTMQPSDATFGVDVDNVHPRSALGPMIKTSAELLTNLFLQLRGVFVDRLLKLNTFPPLVSVHLKHRLLSRRLRSGSFPGVMESRF
jgi:hypothetical protein